MDLQYQIKSHKNNLILCFSSNKGFVKYTNSVSKQFRLSGVVVDISYGCISLIYNNKVILHNASKGVHLIHSKDYSEELLSKIHTIFKTFGYKESDIIITKNIRPKNKVHAIQYNYEDSKRNILIINRWPRIALCPSRCGDIVSQFTIEGKDFIIRPSITLSINRTSNGESYTGIMFPGRVGGLRGDHFEFSKSDKASGEEDKKIIFKTPFLNVYNKVNKAFISSVEDPIQYIESFNKQWEGWDEDLEIK
jgi:hypothetical protein